MRRKKVVEIVIPFKEGMPFHPCVKMNDKIIHAIELMANHNLNQIVVVRNKQPVGMIRLEDALRILGLQAPPIKGSVYNTYKKENF